MKNKNENDRENWCILNDRNLTLYLLHCCNHPQRSLFIYLPRAFLTQLLCRKSCVPSNIFRVNNFYTTYINRISARYFHISVWNQTEFPNLNLKGMSHSYFLARPKAPAAILSSMEREHLLTDIWNRSHRLFSSNPKIALCKRIHEGPGFRIPASKFRIPASGFRIPYQSGFRIPNHCGFWILSGFRIPTAKICWIPDSLTWGDKKHSAFPATIPFGD